MQENIIIKKDKFIEVRKKFLLVNISEYYNNDGISYDDLKCDGDFDGQGATYPAEELPPSNSLIEISGIPFFFPSKEAGQKNNMVLSGQVIPVDKNTYGRLYILGAAEGQNGEVFEEEITISLGDGTYQPIYIGLSNWLLKPVYNDHIAFICSHLHSPDPGQTTIRNPKEVASYIDYNVDGQAASYLAKELIDIEGANQISWKPKILMQSVKLEFDRSITAITVMENLNFHIFCLTLEIK